MLWVGYRGSRFLEVLVMLLTLAIDRHYLAASGCKRTAGCCLMRLWILGWIEGREGRGRVWRYA